MPYISAVGGKTMVEFVMKFADIEVGRSAAELLIDLGYPVVYFIHDYITIGGNFFQYGTVEMIAPEKIIFND
jgi:hypothetical protein